MRIGIDESLELAGGVRSDPAGQLVLGRGEPGIDAIFMLEPMCYHVELQKIVVDMKDNLEKIKEQVLNIL